jgi:hypothetical protein
MDEVKRHVGIDVAKAQLDVFIRPAANVCRSPMTMLGFADCLRSLNPRTL